MSHKLEWAPLGSTLISPGTAVVSFYLVTTLQVIHTPDE